MCEATGSSYQATKYPSRSTNRLSDLEVRECQPADILLKFALHAERDPKFVFFSAKRFRFMQLVHVQFVGLPVSWRIEREGFKPSARGGLRLAGLQLYIELTVFEFDSCSETAALPVDNFAEPSGISR